MGDENPAPAPADPPPVDPPPPPAANNNAPPVAAPPPPSAITNNIARFAKRKLEAMDEDLKKTIRRYKGGRWQKGGRGRPPKDISVWAAQIDVEDDDDDDEDESETADAVKEPKKKKQKKQKPKHDDDEDEDDDGEDKSIADNDYYMDFESGRSDLDFVDDGLVPVRLDIEVGDKRLQEMMLVRRGDMPAQKIAELLVADMDLPSIFEELVKGEIISQMDRCPRMAHNPDAGELRRAISLDIRIGIVRITDKIDWDLNRRMDEYSPEDFAKQFASEMHLAQEFTPIIAFALREQLVVHTQAVLEGRMMQGIEMAPLKKFATRQVIDIDDWSPDITVLSFDEVDKLDKERLRTDRVMRREARRKRY